MPVMSEVNSLRTSGRGEFSARRGGQRGRSWHRGSYRRGSDRLSRNPGDSDYVVSRPSFDIRSNSRPSSLDRRTSRAHFSSGRDSGRGVTDGRRQSDSSLETTLNAILARLDQLENLPSGGHSSSVDVRPRSSEQHVTFDLQARSHSSEAAFFKSENKDFSTLMRSFLRYGQLSHHQLAWVDCPRFLSMRIDDIVHNICPPLAGDDFRRNLDSVANDFKSNIISLVQDHLTTQRVLIKDRTISLDPRDSEMARELALRQLDRRLNKRLNRSRVISSFDEIDPAKRPRLSSTLVDQPLMQPSANSSDWVRVQRRSTHDAKAVSTSVSLGSHTLHSPVPIKTSNRFLPLQFLDDQLEPEVTNVSSRPYASTANDAVLQRARCSLTGPRSVTSAPQLRLVETSTRFELQPSSTYAEAVSKSAASLPVAEVVDRQLRSTTLVTSTLNAPSLPASAVLTHASGRHINASVSCSTIFATSTTMTSTLASEHADRAPLAEVASCTTLSSKLAARRSSYLYDRTQDVVSSVDSRRRDSLPWSPDYVWTDADVSLPKPQRATSRLHRRSSSSKAADDSNIHRRRSSLPLQLPLLELHMLDDPPFSTSINVGSTSAIPASSTVISSTSSLMPENIPPSTSGGVASAADVARTTSASTRAVSTLHTADQETPSNSDLELCATLDEFLRSPAPKPDIRIHRPNCKQNWFIDRIKPHMTILILADSNGSAIAQTNLPRGCTIDVFRGAQLNNIVQLLTHSRDVFADITTMVFVIGINDLHTPTDQLLTSLIDIRDWSELHMIRPIFTNVPSLPSFSAAAKQFVADLNSAASDVFGSNFVPVIHETDISLIKNDTSGFHYTVDTASILVENLKHFL